MNARFSHSLAFRTRWWERGEEGRTVGERRETTQGGVELSDGGPKKEEEGGGGEERRKPEGERDASRFVLLILSLEIRNAIG